MDKTKNLGLSKPTANDIADIEIISKNMDIIDDAIQELDERPTGGGDFADLLSSQPVFSEANPKEELTEMYITGRMG